MSFASTWLVQVERIAHRLRAAGIEALVELVRRVRHEHGRIFVLGVGGSAANASHCVNDLRRRLGVEAYAPTDGVAELLACCNDEPDGWHTMFERWLRESHLGEDDLVLILSVSGATPPLVAAAAYAHLVGATVAAILGTADSLVQTMSDLAIVVPCAHPAHRAGHAEAFQAVVWHAVVAHPRLAS